SICIQSDLVELPDLRDQAAKPIDLRREMFRYFGFEEGKIIRKTERNVRKRDPRTDLLTKPEFLPIDAKLPEQLAQGCASDARGDVVGHRMKPDIVFTAIEAVEAVQATDDIVAFKEPDRFPEVGQTNRRGESRHPGSDNHHIVMFLL